LSLTKSGKVSFVREATSEAEARVALKRPMATVVKVRMLTVNEVNGRAWVKALGRRRFPSNDRSIYGGEGETAECRNR
jgi:hypothetical protein